MIPIPYRWQFTRTRQGTVLKVVQCENCATRYGYWMGREAQGSGTDVLFLDGQGATQRAVRQASQRLKKALETECDAVPCPECGWYQTAMIPMVRLAYHRWMYVVGALGVVAATIGLMGTFVFMTISEKIPEPRTMVEICSVIFGVAFMGALFLTLRKVLSLLFDPNRSNQETRKTLGQLQALRGEELEKLRESSA